MKSIIRLALALSALALAAPAAAAEQQRPKIGLGIAIAPYDAAGVLPAIEVYVPIRIAPQFRLEPSLGIYTRNAPTGGTDTSDITLGIGAFWVKQISAPVDLYAGGRLKLDFASSDDGVTSDSDTNIVLAGALGGEYYLVSQFSLGLEAQLGLYQRGTAGAFGGDDSGFFTTGLAFLRLYF